MKIKIAEASELVIDFLVAKCEIPNDVRDNRPRFWLHPNNPKLVCRETYNHETNPKGYELCRYSTDWAQGGPIIDREKLCVGYQHQCDPEYVPLLDPATICWARTTAGGYLKYGPTPLVAALRCFVASRLGDEVEVPDELLCTP